MIYAYYSAFEADEAEASAFRDTDSTDTNDDTGTNDDTNSTGNTGDTGDDDRYWSEQVWTFIT